MGLLHFIGRPGAESSQSIATDELAAGSLKKWFKTRFQEIWLPAFLGPKIFGVYIYKPFLVVQGSTRTTDDAKKVMMPHPPPA